MNTLQKDLQSVSTNTVASLAAMSQHKLSRATREAVLSPLACSFSSLTTSWFLYLPPVFNCGRASCPCSSTMSLCSGPSLLTLWCAITRWVLTWIQMIFPWPGASTPAWAVPLRALKMFGFLDSGNPIRAFIETWSTELTPPFLSHCASFLSCL